ncbi:nucleotidyltransferase family protein [Arcobacteraceae bacterium]|nr:nucleotidyltransferase family protein [Arcobacteraceae bacterium]
MTAMILAAGRGERMRPLTDNTPKPLLKVKDKSLIIWHIEKLASSGFTTIIINIAHLGEQIIESLGDGTQWGIKIIYSDERVSGALETAGAIVKALPTLSEIFLVVNADIWCDYDFNSDFNLDNSSAHLILVPNPEHNLKGDFLYEGEHYTFSGIGYYSKKVFENLSLEKRPLAPILKELIAQDKTSFELHDGVWSDIGTRERLALVNTL